MESGMALFTSTTVLEILEGGLTSASMLGWGSLEPESEIPRYVGFAYQEA